MELNEEQKLLLEQLDKACKDVAASFAEVELHKTVVKDPTIDKETKRKALFQKNYPKIFESMKEMFLRFSEIYVILNPYLEASNPKDRDKIIEDFQKLAVIGDKISEIKNQEPIAIQQLCDFSDATLNWLYNVSLDCINNNQLDSAIDLLRYINFINPYIAESWTSLGFCHQKQHHLVEALESFSIAKILNPEIIQPRLFSAYCYFDLNKSQEAMNEVNELEIWLERSLQKEQFLPYLHNLKNRYRG